MNLKATFKNIAIGSVAISFFTLIGCETSDIKNMVSDGNAMSMSKNKISPINLSG